MSDLFRGCFMDSSHPRCIH